MHTPIDQHSFDLRFGVLVKKNPEMSEGISRMWIESQVQMSQGAFGQDVEIWNNKVQVDNPILCDGDGPVGMLRKWFHNFYVDVDQLPDNYHEKQVAVVDLS
jgi:3-ketosteroid 9alpha-monooxygenase subunit A